MVFRVTDKIVVFSTCGDESEAKRVSHHLVSERVAACVTIVPGAASVYRWKGKVEESQEWVLIIKSSRAAFPKLQEELQRVHSYQVPEVVAIPVVDGSPSYLEWLDREIELQ